MSRRFRQQDLGGSLLCQASDGEPNAPDLVEKSTSKTSLVHRRVDDLLRSSQRRGCTARRTPFETTIILVLRHLSFYLTEYKVENGCSSEIEEGGGTAANNKSGDGVRIRAAARTFHDTQQHHRPHRLGSDSFYTVGGLRVNVEP